MNWSIAPQVVEDRVTGLTLEFVIVAGEPHLRLSGDRLPFGNRQLEFAVNGTRTGAGCGVSCTPRPKSWSDRVKVKPRAAGPRLSSGGGPGYEVVTEPDE